MDPTQIISKKITLLGSHAVGKTSLIAQFVEGKFPESYVTTIGLKVDKKSVIMESHQLDLLIWDIAGHEDPTKFPAYYLNGCHGYIYVVDLSRPETVKGLKERLEQLDKMLPNVPWVVVGNKVDLISEADLEKLKKKDGKPLEILASAKTGLRVNEVFNKLGQKMMEQHEST